MNSIVLGDDYALNLGPLSLTQQVFDIHYRGRHVFRVKYCITII